MTMCTVIRATGRIAEKWSNARSHLVDYKYYFGKELYNICCQVSSRAAKVTEHRRAKNRECI
jgi:hypothetical protein